MTVDPSVPVLHEVSWLQHYIDRLLRRVPTSLCGLRLDDPRIPDMPPGSPRCPDCAAR